MKVTKSKLKQLIKEEIQNILEQNDNNVISLDAKRRALKPNTPMGDWVRQAKEFEALPKPAGAGGLSNAEREALNDAFRTRQNRGWLEVIENDIEITPKKSKAPLSVAPKGNMPKAPPFKLEPKFIPWAKRLPLVGRYVRAATDLADLARLEQVYRKQGAGPALVELIHFVAGLMPGVGDAMVIRDIGNYLEQRKTAKAQEFVDALKTAGKGATSISAEPPKPSLNTKMAMDLVRGTRIEESNMKLTKSKLQQLIKEELKSITEDDRSVEHPYLNAFKAYEKEIKRKLMDPNLKGRELTILRQDKIDLIDNIKYAMTKARIKTDAQKSAYLKKEWPNHPAFKSRVRKGVPSTIEIFPVTKRGGDLD